MATNSKIFEISNNTIIESRNTIIFENTFPMKNKLIKFIGKSSFSNSKVNNDTISLENQELDKLRRSKRRKIENQFGLNFYTFLVEEDPKSYQ